MTNEQSKYIFLDGDAEREQLIEQIHKVRESVLKYAESVPESDWYKVRYHGWSLAAMIGHLNLMDNLNMLWIKMGLMGMRFPLGGGFVDGINSTMSGVFKNRVLITSLKSIPKNEERIAKFIRELPLNRMSQEVYHPQLRKYLTVEQALQSFFLHHWEEHLETMLVTAGLQAKQESSVKDTSDASDTPATPKKDVPLDPFTDIDDSAKQGDD